MFLEYIIQENIVIPIESKLFQSNYDHGGAVISFLIEKEIGEIEQTLSKLKHIKMAPSFGSIDSLIEIPSVMSHHGKTKEQLQRSGIEISSPLSVGCEPLEMLISDLSHL